MVKDRVPELSLSDYTQGDAQTRREFSEQLFHSLKQFGFIVLKDHPISEQLLQKAYCLSEEFFQLDLDRKMSYTGREGGGQRGYTPFGKEHAKDSQVPDLKEFWHVGRDLSEDHRFYNTFPKNIWPQELPDFKSTFQELYQSLDHVGQIILRALTGPLEVPEDYFDVRVDAGNSILRLLHYPPIPEGVDPRCIRAAAHEDVNLMTILVSASASGLELLSREGKWIPIDTDPSNLIVDSGDMMARITNDIIPSTTHRVVNPAGENKSRYSMPFFIHPNPDTVLRCLPSCEGKGAKYKDIGAEDFLMERLREIGLV